MIQISEAIEAAIKFFQWKICRRCAFTGNGIWPILAYWCFEVLRVSPFKTS